MFQLKAEISNHPRVVSQQVDLLSPFSFYIGRLYLIQLSLILMMMMMVMMLMINDENIENDDLLCVTRFCSLKKMIVTIKTVHISLPPWFQNGIMAHVKVKQWIINFHVFHYSYLWQQIIVIFHMQTMPFLVWQFWILTWPSVVCQDRVFRDPSSCCWRTLLLLAT